MTRGFVATILVLSVLFIDRLACAEEVKIPDANLRQLIREVLQRKQVEGDTITEEHLSNIYFLHGNGRKVKDLTGLDFCWNLREVRLADNEFTNIEPLAKCVDVQSLDLAGNKIEDIRPLAALQKIQYLNLDKNRIKGIEVVAELTALSALHIADNRVECLTPIRNLKKLSSLRVANNKIQDLRPIATVRWLSSLDLANNQITDVTPLASLTELRWTFLQGNQIKDIQPIVEMAQTDAAGEQRFAPFWRLYLGGNPIDEASNKRLDLLREAGVRLNMDEKPVR